MGPSQFSSPHDDLVRVSEGWWVSKQARMEGSQTKEGGTRLLASSAQLPQQCSHVHSGTAT